MKLVGSIIRTFETGRPQGNYSAVAVLNDGAGISYGAGQFTQRSGSLAAVVKRYLANGGRTGRNELQAALPLISLTDAASIRRAVGDRELRRALAEAGRTRTMRAAQDAILKARYLTPALRECTRRGFTEPLSLAVIYDSLVHGSFARIAKRVGSVHGERAWITAYVRRRHEWLRSIPRLRVTSYRTAFFLGEILKQNWELATPLNVNGRRIDVARNVATDAAAYNSPSAAETYDIDRVQGQDDAAESRVDRLIDDIPSELPRRDSRRSLWTTVLGTIGQAAFAVASFVAGLPIEFWLGAALIIAVIIIVYLYRQLALGRIRESACTNCKQENQV